MKYLNKENGFTFIEISIVILIIAILIAVAVPNYQGVKNEAADSAIKADIGTLENAFSLAAVTNSSLGKDAVAAGTIVNALSDMNGDIIDPNTRKLYQINTTIASFYKKLNRDIGNYMVDSMNNVYYKGKFQGINGSISAKLESDTGNNTTQKTITGYAIEHRYRHSAVYYNGKMIVFGGDDGTRNSNDCYEIDLTTYVCSKKNLTGASIVGRSFHTAVVYNDKMIIFGGWNGSALNDCYEINLKTYNVVQKSLTGDTIVGRWGHTAVVYNGKMIIFAGGNMSERLNDYYEVDLSNYKVYKKTLTGTVIPERNYHTAVVYNGNMIIFAGYHTYWGWLDDCYSINLSNYKVTKITIAGDSIASRHFHTAVVGNGKMIVFGGAPLTNSCYALDLTTYVSVNMNLVNPPSARYAHSAIMYNGKMVIYAGIDGSNLFSDCYEIE
ncbi:MAG: Kelch repeat-containing protein [Deltaproteobacteria bacterium]